METVKNIAAIIGLILSTITVIGLITNGGRALFNKIFRHGTSKLEASIIDLKEEVESIKEVVDAINNKVLPIEEVSKQTCRNVIKSMYYRYCDSKVLPLYERKTLEYTYKIYKENFGGNSYATTLYNEMIKWDLDPHGQDLYE